MIVERLKEACNEIDWVFNYGKEHWQNLGDYEDDGHLPFEERKKYFLLLWKDRDFIVNQFGAVVGYNFEGEALFVVRSKISDPSYDYKYETHIKNLESETEKMFENITICEDWLIKKWKEIEVSNELDTTLDGLRIRFTLEWRE